MQEATREQLELDTHADNTAKKCFLLELLVSGATVFQIHCSVNFLKLDLLPKPGYVQKLAESLQMTQDGAHNYVYHIYTNELQLLAS